MEALDFIFQTIRHFSMRDGSPPPGIPAHAGRAFEADLAAICERSRIAPIVVDSLERLVLEPPLSRISLERLRLAAAALRKRARRNLDLATRLTLALSSRRIRYAITGETASALLLYPDPETRSVEQVEMLVCESDWQELERTLGGLGFVQPMEVPALSSEKDVLEFFQCFSPCIFGDDAGARVRLRFRLVDFDFTQGREPALDRARPARVSGNELCLLPTEELLVASLLAFGAKRRVDLALLCDIALLCAGGIDWRYVESEVKRRKVSSGFYFALDQALRRLAFQHPGLPRSRKSILKMFLYPQHKDSSGDETGIEARRGVSFYFVHCDSIRKRVSLMKRFFSPRKSWVSTFFGRQYTLYHHIRFSIMALRGKTVELMTRSLPGPSSETAGKHLGSVRDPDRV